jgi:hypothetical protein
MSARPVTVALLAIGLAVLAAGLCTPWVRRGVVRRLFGPQARAAALARYGPDARARLAPHFSRAGLAYPPAEVVLVGFKHEKRLEVYAAPEADSLRPICSYPILGASGTLGPKLREGDGQVPEGLYRVEALHPLSAFHLALRLNYPNGDDLAQAESEGRTNPGGNIMIHGGKGSIGCLAMGDEAIEELYILAADTGVERIGVILSPVDFRARRLPAEAPKFRPWVRDLHGRLEAQVRKLPRAMADAGT